MKIKFCLTNHSNEKLSYLLFILLAIFVLISPIENVKAQNVVINPPIAVDGNPAGMAYDPVHQRIYISNIANNVSVIDTNTNNVLETIGVGNNSISMAYDPVHQRMYVANIGSYGNDGSVSVIDTNTNNVISNINLQNPPNNPDSISYDPVHQRMYVVIGGSIYGSSIVSVIDTNTNRIIGDIDVGYQPQSIAYDPVHQRMYVANYGVDSPNLPFIPGSVSVIDTNTTNIGNSNILGIINFTSNLQGLAYDPLHQRMYVANIGSNNVSVIDTNTILIGYNNVIDNIPLGNIAKGPYGITYDPIHQRMYVTNVLSNTISVIDTITNNIVSNPIAVGHKPDFIAYDPIHQRMYVTNYLDSNIFVINIGSNAQIICPGNNLEHWDKIIFKVTSADIATKSDMPLNSELDIKVLDNVNKVTDLKEKILDFIHLPDNNQTRN